MTPSLRGGTAYTQAVHAPPHPAAPAPLDPAAAWQVTSHLSPRQEVRATPTSDPTANRYTSQVDATRSAPPDRPWAVYLADYDAQVWLLALDFDAKGTQTPHEDATAAATELRAAGLRPVVCSSGPGSGRHVWAALAEPVDATTIRDLAYAMHAAWPSLDITPLTNPATGCVRPPGAPHRDGGSSQIIDGTLEDLLSYTGGPAQINTLAQQLAHLIGPVEQPSDEAPDLPRDRHGLPHLPGDRRPLAPAGAEALTTPLPASADTSRTLRSVLVHAAAARWTYDDIAQHLHDAPGLEHARSMATTTGRRRRTTTQAAAVLRRQWTRAVHHVATRTGTTGHDPTFAPRCETVVDAVLHTQRRADASPGRWSTSTGPAQRRVLDALCHRALTAVRTEVDADIRTLATQTGLGRTSVATALHTLADDGWITRTRAAEGPHAARWAIPSDPTIHRDSQNDRPQVGPRPGGAVGPAGRLGLRHTLGHRLASSTHDAFTPHALGTAAGNTYARLTSTPRTARELASGTGTTPEHTQTHLQRLAAAGLATLTHHGWTRPTNDARDAVAAHAGTTGTLAARAAAYTLEHLLWVWWCTEVAWMRAPGRHRRPTLEAPTLPTVPGGWAQTPSYPRGHDGRGDHTAARAALLGAA